MIDRSSRPRWAVAGTQTALVLFMHAWLFELTWPAALVCAPVLVVGLSTAARRARAVTAGRLLHEQAVAHAAVGAACCLLDGLPSWSWDLSHVGTDVLVLLVYGTALRAVLGLRRQVAPHAAVSPERRTVPVPCDPHLRPSVDGQRRPPSDWLLSLRRTGFRAPPRQAPALG